MKKTKCTAGWKQAAFLLLISLSSFAFSLYQWAFITWPNLQLDEMIYHMKVSMEGVSPEIVRSGVIGVLGPTILCPLFIFVLNRLLLSRRPVWFVLFQKAVSLLSAVVLFATGYAAWQRFGLGAYLFGASEEDFIQANYVDPAECAVVFPEKKKNLIYIYLESMETTFADKASGGAFNENVIPELTELALANEDFSGSSPLLNGAHVLSGSTWTMGAMFGHTSGLPLKISIDGNSMNTQDHFFPALTTLGDILETAGYNQTLLIGSDGQFGGRSLYFQEHGNFAIHDYYHALTEQQIPLGHFVWWGYEDHRLFDIAREEVTSLAAKDEPFNLMLLTVDTHFEDGYTCAVCPSVFKDPYSNVYTCSSKLAADFVEWVQTQDFYEDTVIVLVGDHLTMDSDFCADISTDYSRKVLVSYINTDKEYTGSAPREYSTLDLFPTTLSALGAEIAGSQLGLGVDLFSSKPTLVETFGKNELNQNISRPSALMAKLGEIKLFAESTPEFNYNPDTHKARIGVYDIRGIENEIISVEAVIIDDNGEQKTVLLPLQPDKSYAAEVALTSFATDYCSIRIYATTSNNERYQIASLSGNIHLMLADSVENYLELLGELKDHTILMAVKDDASFSLSDEAANSLHSLGLTADLQNSLNHSYYAVVTPDGCKEELSLEIIKNSGTLPDGVPYMLWSAGFETGSASAHIYIDQTDYSLNTRGMNFVVYDNAASRIVDISTFDTCFDLISTDFSITAAPDGKYLFQLDGVYYAPVPEYCMLYFWHPDHPENAVSLRLDPAGDHAYNAAFALNEPITRDHQFAVFAVPENNRVKRLNCTLPMNDPEKNARSIKISSELSYDPAAQNVLLSTYDLRGINDQIVSVEAIIYDVQGNEQKTFAFAPQPDNTYAASIPLTAFDAEYCTIRIYAATKGGMYYQLFSRSGNIRLMTASSVEDYLSQLGSLENHTVFIAAADDASLSLSNEAASAMRSLGLKEDLQNALRHSYYAVIGPDSCNEKLSLETIRDSGMLSDGVPYVVESSGFETGASGSKIVIGQKNYSPNHRGLNFVVYDNEASRIIDASSFDTCFDSTKADLAIAQNEGGESIFQLSNVAYYPVPEYCKVFCWHPDTPGKVMEIRLEPAGSNVYAATVPAMENITAEHCLAVFAVPENANAKRLDVPVTFVPATP